MIPATVNTCRACRAFRRPADHSVATSRLPTQFNERVQHDVLYLIADTPTTISLWVWWTAQRVWSWFYPSIGTHTHPDDQHCDSWSAASIAPVQTSGQGSSSSTAKDLTPITTPTQKKWPNKVFKQEPCSHIMDMCTRLCQAQRIPDREPHTFIKTLTQIWFIPFGAPRVLEHDEEGAFTSAIMTKWLSDMHTTLVLKPKGTHTWMVERHHDLLRELYSTIRYQAN